MRLTLQPNMRHFLTGRIFRRHLIVSTRRKKSVAAAAAASRRDLDAEVNVDFVRNVGIVAHIDAGKTTTTERLLYLAGLTRHLGDIDDGDTVTDFMQQERERGITITSAAVSFRWKGHRVNLIDTPGHVDFTMEVERSLRVLDGVVLVLDGSAGVEAQTRTVWRQASKRSIPCVVFVNKMDKNNADLEKSLNSIEKKLNVPPLLLQIPLGEKREFRGVVDLLSLTKVEWKTGGKMKADGTDVKISPLCKDADSSVFSSALSQRRLLVEKVADLDDAFAEAFLAVEDPLKMRPDALKTALRRLTLSRMCLPVTLGAALRNVGVQPLMDAVNDFLPSPRDVARDFLLDDRVLRALAFKIFHDPNKGPLTFVRVYSGQLMPGSLHNVNQGVADKVAKIYSPFADEFSPASSISAGHIGVLAGLTTTRSGDTLTLSASQARSLRKEAETGEESHSHAAIDIPEPVFFCSVEPPSLSAVKDLDRALERLQKEDPSLRVKVDPDTNQTVLAGMGELHLEIILDRIRREFKVDADLGAIQIVYQEALHPDSPPVDETFVYDRIVKGKRCYVEISLRVSPARKDDAGDVFNYNNFLSSEKRSDLPIWVLERQLGYAGQGVKSALASGPLLGFPVTGARVSLLGLSTMKGVIPTGIIAATAACVSSALKKSRCILFEPVMDVDVSVEGCFAESVASDLRRRRGVDVSTSWEGDFRVVIAKVPLVEMMGYAKDVRTATGGTAAFSMRLAGYNQMNESETSRLLEEKRLTGR